MAPCQKSNQLGIPNNHGTFRYFSSNIYSRNQDFLTQKVYQKFFQELVKNAVNAGFIRGIKVALDSSFVPTYSSKQEVGSEGWNGFKKSFGFKLHALVDAETRFPIALIVTNGLAADCTLAIPLLKKAKRYLKKKGYVLADKGL